MSFQARNLTMTAFGLPRDHMLQLLNRAGVSSPQELINRYRAVAVNMKANESTIKGPIGRGANPSPSRPYEVKVLPNTLAGCAVLYNDPIFSYRRAAYSTDLPLVFRPGCFEFDDDIPLVDGHYWSHVEQIFARTKRGTLSLTDSTKGLYFTAHQIPDNEYSRRSMADVTSGAIAGCSVGFVPQSASVGYHHGLRCEIVTRAALGHIALVDAPGCKATWVRLF